jgi:hypothetical protein
MKAAQTKVKNSQRAARPARICARRIGRPDARGGYSYPARLAPQFNACITSVIAGR